MLKQRKPNLVMLASDSPTTWIIYNRLVQQFGPFPALIENHISRYALLKSRVRNLGLWTALGQAAFVVMIRPILERLGRSRIQQICQTEGLEPHKPTSSFLKEIRSVNSDACAAFLRKAGADVVVINGTRILGPNILGATDAVFINTHQGITPRYRGAHGAYWALDQDDADNCGVTVHLVDEGIDTGGIVAQARIVPQANDSYSTYPYLQTAAALPLLLAAIGAILAGTLDTTTPEGPSQVWYHPGFFTYVMGRLRGVK